MQLLSSPLIQFVGTLASTLGLGIAGVDLISSAFGAGVALGAAVVIALVLTFGWGILVGIFSLRYWQQQSET